MASQAFGLNIKVKAMFFDRDRVKRSMDRTNRKALSKSGGLVRKTAIYSIKDSSKPSTPGNPPHSRLGAKRKKQNRQRKREGKKSIRGGFKGLKHILYAYDSTTEQVIVGPVSNRRGKVPGLLEFGGTVKARKKGRPVSAKVAPRPFMKPALEKNKSEMPKQWKNAIRG